jgi:hypothetical protein
MLKCSWCGESQHLGPSLYQKLRDFEGPRNCASHKSEALHLSNLYLAFSLENQATALYGVLIAKLCLGITYIRYGLPINGIQLRGHRLIYGHVRIIGLIKKIKMELEIDEVVQNPSDSTAKAILSF